MKHGSKSPKKTWPEIFGLKFGPARIFGPEIGLARKPDGPRAIEKAGPIARGPEKTQPETALALGGKHTWYEPAGVWAHSRDSQICWANEQMIWPKHLGLLVEICNQTINTCSSSTK